MKLNSILISEHVIELSTEIKKEFKEELSPLAHNSYLKRKANEALKYLELGIVSVDILRSPDFNSRLDKKINFYGMKLNCTTADGHLYARLPNIRKSLQLTTEFMNKKDQWKIFISTILLEIQDIDNDGNYNNLLRLGSDYKFPLRKDLKEVVDLVVIGPRSTDFPLLMADFCGTSNFKEGYTKFNPIYLQKMMLDSLLHQLQTRSHWPLPELGHIPVFGLLIERDEFVICRMALRLEKSGKMAVVFTKGKRILPYNLFTVRKIVGTFNEQAVAQTRRGDADSTDEDEYSSEDDFENWITYHKNDQAYSFEEEFELLQLEEEHAAQKLAKEAKNKTILSNGAKATKKLNGGAVTAIVSLLQMVIAHQEEIKAKDSKYKHRK